LYKDLKMLIAIAVILFVLGALFFSTIILLASERDFFKIITINTLLLLGYLFVAQKYSAQLSEDNLFGVGKLWFLVICLSIQVVVGFIHAIKRKRKHLEAKRKKILEPPHPEQTGEPLN